MKPLGFRSWRLKGYALLGTGAGAWGDGRGKWGPEVNEAVCLRHEYQQWMDNPVTIRTGDHRVVGPPLAARHQAPQQKCTCGLYAYHEQGFAVPLHSSSGDAAVYGAVLAAGKIAVHHKGFRAQYAKPILFAYHKHQSVDHVERLMCVAGEWGIPVVHLAELETAAQEYGEAIKDRPELCREPLTEEMVQRSVALYYKNLAAKQRPHRLPFLRRFR